MTQLNSSQILFMRSTAENAFRRNDDPLRISVESAAGNTILLSIERSEDATLLETNPNTKSSSKCNSLEKAVDKIIAAVEKSEGTLLIEQEQTIQRVGIKKGAIVRETVEKRPAILKQPLWAVGKTTHLDPDRAAPLLQTIGLMTAQGEIKAPMRKKFKQVNHFIELLRPHLPQEKTSKPYVIVDCGCGKSYLGFVLFWYVRHVLKRPARFIGIDVVQERIDECQQRAKRLHLKEMQFECASNRTARLPDEIDLLVALHACDTATDEALALAVAHQAKHIAAAPCCQHELAGQIDGVPYYPLVKHGLFKQRFADLLTDMTRCLFLEAHGYSVTVGEFVSVEETPKNLLIRAKHGSRDAGQRMGEYESFKHHYGIAPSIDNILLELQIIQ